MTARVKRIPVLDVRRAGILLHPSSLPGGIGNGDFGPEAFHFVDFLVTCGASVWQMLPLCPTHGDRSPYMGLSVFAGDPYLISAQLLVDWAWLDHGQVQYEVGDDTGRFRHHCLVLARQGFEARASDDDRSAYDRFINKHQYWLDDYAIFQALRKELQGRSWVEWPKPLRDRQPQALRDARSRLADDVSQVCFEQFVFFKQWSAIKTYANEQGIRIFGDMPIFVSHDSADVWANRHYFDLDEQGRARTISGVPPDYFSETGQRWGNPHYNWKAMRAGDFKWWVDRIHGTLELFDLIRVDHFRGFEAYWEIKSSDDIAINGRWVKSQGRALFNSLLKHFPQLPFVAEDLGIITPAVDRLRKKYAWPGMKILQFAFDGSVENPYLPHNYDENCVVYTGTHDNDTTLSWFENLAPETRQSVYDYFGPTHEEMPWLLIRAALASTARLAVIPMQDILALGQGHRMNTPGVSEGNWQWRFTWQGVSDDVPGRFSQLVKRYGRVGRNKKD